MVTPADILAAEGINYQDAVAAQLGSADTPLGEALRASQQALTFQAAGVSDWASYWAVINAQILAAGK
jgi:hypothetical protein